MGGDYLDFSLRSLKGVCQDSTFLKFSHYSKLLGCAEGGWVHRWVGESNVGGVAMNMDTDIWVYGFVDMCIDMCTDGSLLCDVMC